MDEGEIRLNFDDVTGLAEISIRAPLHIDFVTVQVPATSMVEFAANITLISIKKQRDMMAALANKRQA